MRAATLARLSLVALVAATFLAIFYAQELKRETALLLRPNKVFVQPFQPAGPITRPHLDRFAHFRVQSSVSDTLDISIVSERTGRTVALLRVPVSKYHSVWRVWNGMTAAGALAPPGFYRLRIHFVRDGQTVVAKETLQLLRPPA